jgi:hypothetical protein
VKNVVNRQQLLFTKTWRHSKFGSILCKVRWEKHPRAFAKVVESSELYNFPIHYFVHFYSKFWRILRSNKAQWIASRRARTAPRRRALCPRPYRGRASPTLCTCAARHPRPRVPSQGRPAPLDASKSPLAPRAGSRAASGRLDGHRVRPPDRPRSFPPARRTTVCSPPLVTKQAGRRLLKAAPPPSHPSLAAAHRVRPPAPLAPPQVNGLFAHPRPLGHPQPPARPRASPTRLLPTGCCSSFAGFCATADTATLRCRAPSRPASLPQTSAQTKLRWAPVPPPHLPRPKTPPEPPDSDEPAASIGPGTKPRTKGIFVRNQKFQGPASKLFLE